MASIDIHAVSMALGSLSMEEEGFKKQMGDILRYLLKKVDDHYPWERVAWTDAEITQDLTFTTFTEYLGKWSRFSVDDLEKLFSDDPEVIGLLAEVTKGIKGKRSDLVYNIPHVEAGAKKGTSSQAGHRRLSKDRPDLHEMVIRGSISVNAAMIEAGFRKKYYQVEATKEAVVAFCEKHGIEL